MRAPFSSIAHSHRPHPFGRVGCAPADGLLDSKGFDVAVVKEIIESPAVKAVSHRSPSAPPSFHNLVRALVSISRSSGWTHAKGRPVISSNISSLGLFHEQECPGRIFHDTALVAGRIPRRQGAVVILDIYPDAMLRDRREVVRAYDVAAVHGIGSSLGKPRPGDGDFNFVSGAF